MNTIGTRSSDELSSPSNVHLNDMPFYLHHSMSVQFFFNNLFVSFQNLLLFRQVVRDVFQGLPEPPMGPPTTTSSMYSRSADIEQALESTASDSGLMAHKPWIEKCIQLYNISQSHQGRHIDGLVQDCSNSIANALELLQSCAKPST